MGCAFSEDVADDQYNSRNSDVSSRAIVYCGASRRNKVEVSSDADEAEELTHSRATTSDAFGGSRPGSAGGGVPNAVDDGHVGRIDASQSPILQFDDIDMVPPQPAAGRQLSGSSGPLAGSAPRAAENPFARSRLAHSGSGSARGGGRQLSLSLDASGAAGRQASLEASAASYLREPSSFDVEGGGASGRGGRSFGAASLSPAMSRTSCTIRSRSPSATVSSAMRERGLPDRFMSLSISLPLNAAASGTERDPNFNSNDNMQQPQQGANSATPPPPEAGALDLPVIPPKDLMAETEDELAQLCAVRGTPTGRVVPEPSFDESQQRVIRRLRIAEMRDPLYYVNGGGAPLRFPKIRPLPEPDLSKIRDHVFAWLAELDAVPSPSSAPLTPPPTSSVGAHAELPPSSSATDEIAPLAPIPSTADAAMLDSCHNVRRTSVTLPGQTQTLE